MSDLNLGIVESGVMRSSLSVFSASNQYGELVEEPKWSDVDETDTVDAVLPDDDAEILLERMYYESDGTWEFYFHNGDTTRIGETFSVTANPGTFKNLSIRMGGGNPVGIKVTKTTGTLRIWVEYVVRRKAFRKVASAYVVA